MSQFFIERPSLPGSSAIFIAVAGIVAIPQLPVARFPDVAPPSISIFATYSGADVQTVSDSVIRPIEKELASVKNVLYYESSVDSTGGANISVTFKPGTDPEMAQVDVQNRLKNADAVLPEQVRRNGVSVEASESGFLMLITLKSTTGDTDELSLGDYLTRNLGEELKRVPGVGRVQQFGSERAMRVWVDPSKLAAYGLTMTDVTEAIARENARTAPGRVGDEPTVPGTRLSTPLTVRGQLSTPEAICRHSTAGAGRRRAPPSGRCLAGGAGRADHGLQRQQQRQARRCGGDPDVARRQCGAHGGRRRGAPGRAAGGHAQGHAGVGVLQHRALREGLDQEGRRNSRRGHGTGLPGHAAVPAEDPLYADPDHRGSHRLARDLLGDVARRILGQTC